MKRQIKKIADLTQKQYEAALARNGMELTQDGHNPDIDTISLFGFELTGKTRRARLAQAIEAKDEYDESQIRDEDEFSEEIEAEEIEDLDEAEATFEAEAADGVISKHVPSHEEEAAATDAARREQDITAPVHGAVIPSGKAHPVKGEFASKAVADRFEALKAEKGAEVAGTLLQEAIKACGQKIFIDGKVGPYTVRLANRIAESELLAALTSRSQVGSTEKAS